VKCDKDSDKIEIIELHLKMGANISPQLLLRDKCLHDILCYQNMSYEACSSSTI
jgi:hypothetical protein